MGWGVGELYQSRRSLGDDEMVSAQTFRHRCGETVSPKTEAAILAGMKVTF